MALWQVKTYLEVLLLFKIDLLVHWRCHGNVLWWFCFSSPHIHRPFNFAPPTEGSSGMQILGLESSISEGGMLIDFLPFAVYYSVFMVWIWNNINYLCDSSYYCILLWRLLVLFICYSILTLTKWLIDWLIDWLTGWLT